MNVSFGRCICVIVLLSLNTEGLKVIFERIKLISVNEKYEYNVSVFISRHSRRTAYVLNIEGTTLQTWGDNVTISLYFHEYLHNEYRRSFIELHFPLCKFMDTTILGTLFESTGFKCPSPPGSYKLHNMTIPTSRFPYLWPYNKAMIEINGTATDHKKESMFSAHLYAHFGDVNPTKVP